MAYIRVVYNNEDTGFDYVPSHRLEALIIEEEISHFYRPAEERWISIKFDRVKGSGEIYEGPERRGIISRTHQGLEKDENKRSPIWLKGLWREIGKS